MIAYPSYIKCFCGLIIIKKFNLVGHIFTLSISLSLKSPNLLLKKKVKTLHVNCQKLSILKLITVIYHFRSQKKKKTYDGNGNECFNRAFSLLRISLSENWYLCCLDTLLSKGLTVQWCCASPNEETGFKWSTNCKNKNNP